MPSGRLARALPFVGGALARLGGPRRRSVVDHEHRAGGPPHARPAADVL